MNKKKLYESIVKNAMNFQRKHYKRLNEGEEFPPYDEVDTVDYDETPIIKNDGKPTREDWKNFVESIIVNWCDGLEHIEDDYDQFVHDMSTAVDYFHNDDQHEVEEWCEENGYNYDTLEEDLDDDFDNVIDEVVDEKRAEVYDRLDYRDFENISDEDEDKYGLIYPADTDIVYDIDNDEI